jgi:hypothetical protein
VKSLALFVGPIILPKAIGYYRKFKASQKNSRLPIRPAPFRVTRGLGLLFVIAVVALISTLPYFQPENIFETTNSRVQINPDVLFTRLNAMRPNGLTDFDNLLRDRMLSLDSRLLYLKFGPDTIGNCHFCNADNHKDYLYYSIPGLLAPHLLNLCILGLVTSGLFVGAEGAVWRRFATLGAITVGAIDLFLLANYEHKLNATNTRLEDLDMFYWRLKMYRGVGIASFNALLGWLIWLSSTNRAFVVPQSSAEKVESAVKRLESIRSKISATAVVRNTLNRDDALRARAQEYWVTEGRLMGEAMEDREVMDSVKNALESRVNIDRIQSDADTYAKSVLGGIQLHLGETSAL